MMTVAPFAQMHTSETEDFELVDGELIPISSAIEVRRKVRDYLRAGSKEVWLLDHSNCEVMVHSSSGIRALQGTDVLADLG